MSELDVNTESNPAQSPAPAPSAPDFAVATQPSYAHTLFMGPDGLRPGWGFAFYVAMFYPLQKLAVDLASSWDLGSSGLWSMMLEELGNLVAAVIPALVLARVERRPWKVYGLPGKQAFGRLFWVGALWGFAGISLLMFALYGLHAFAFGHVLLHGARLVRFAAFWAVMFLLVGLFEEFLLRGYTQFTLTRGIGFWPAAVVMSCMFGLIHLRNDHEQWRGLLAAAFIGFFFCLTLATHRQSLVCRGLSRRMGLGRDLLLLRARQRHGRSRSPAAFVAARRRVAQRRIGGPGRQRVLPRGHRGGMDRVREDASESGCSRRPRVMVQSEFLR